MWTYRISPDPAGNADWVCVPGDDTRAWDVAEGLMRDAAELYGENEEFTVSISHVKADPRDCSLCPDDDCKARVAEYAG